MKRICIIGLALVLASCGRGAESGPQGVSADEARALDDAARMLDSRRPPPDLLRPSAAGPPTGQPTAEP